MGGSTDFCLLYVVPAYDASAIHYNDGDHGYFSLRVSFRILIVRTSSLGDVVYAAAVLADIRRAFPETVIDWVAEEAFVAIPRLAGAARVIPFALRRWRRQWRRADAWRELAAFRRVLREQSYDCVIDLNEQVKSALIARSATTSTRHGFSKTSIREPLATLFYQQTHVVPRKLHFVERCRLLAAQALHYEVVGAPQWHWTWPDQDMPDDITLPDQPYVVLLSATSRADKLWPEMRWRMLIAACAERGLTVLLPWGAPEEEARCRRLAQEFRHAQVLPRMSLPALGRVLQGARWTVGVDTGLTHWSAALGTPTVAIFTATSPTQLGVGVQGPHARDIGKRGVVPTFEEVLSVVESLPGEGGQREEEKRGGAS